MVFQHCPLVARVHLIASAPCHSLIGDNTDMAVLFVRLRCPSITWPLGNVSLHACCVSVLQWCGVHKLAPAPMSQGHHIVGPVRLFPHSLCPSTTLCWNSSSLCAFAIFQQSWSVGKLIYPPVPAPTCDITGRPICLSALCQVQYHSVVAQPRLLTTCSIS